MDRTKNPFPGMNPYLERRWGDVHASLATYARDVLQGQLPGDLRARMQERVVIETSGEGVMARQGYSPDVHVFERPGHKEIGAHEVENGGVATMTESEPIIIQIPAIEVIETYVEIIDVASGGKVITTIEFISRSNKRPGPGRKKYLRKRKETIRSGASVIEIDLLRGGKSVTLATPVLPGVRPWNPCHASVLRAWTRDRVEFYPAPLRARLPNVKVPLRKKDKDVRLDVQSLIDEAYRKGRYDDIDYSEPLDPPLQAEDVKWVEQLLKQPAKS